MSIKSKLRDFWYGPEENPVLTTRQMVKWLTENDRSLAQQFTPAELELALEDGGYYKAPIKSVGDPFSDAGWITAHQQALGLRKVSENDKGETLSEAFTQADIELALDDRGWLVGGKRMMGELDPLSRQVQVNRSRYYWLRDPLAKQAVRLWTDYAFGDTAVGYTCEDNAIQAKLDAFMKARTNRRFASREGMRRMSQRLLVDGELFIIINEADSVTNGKAPTIRTVDCLQITDIITDPDDADNILAYKRVMTGKDGNNKVLYYKPWDAQQPDKTTLDTKTVANDGYNLVPIDPNGKKTIQFVDGCVMYHVAFDAIERRGNGLLSSCSDWAREHRRFMIARVAITQALSKFAFKTTVKGGQNIVNSIRAKLESTFGQSGLSGGTQHQPVAAPGANFLANEGVSLEAMPRVTGGSEAATDANGLKLMVSAGTGIMLHYFGDPGTGNLATATAMELPMLKMFMSYQVYWKDIWRDLFSIVLEENDEAPPAEIVITMPAILEDDLQGLATFLTSLVGAFPEAKVPALLKMCLESANVPDLDEVMQDIEDKKEELDAQQQLQSQQTQNNALALVKAKQAKPGQTSTDPAEQGVLSPDTPASVAESKTEADSIKALTAALISLKECLQ